MASTRTTHTYALLEVTPAAYAEVEGKLRDAGYDHALHDGHIDMQGIALTRDPNAPAWTPTPAFEELREAWLDAPFDGIVPKGNGEWLQRLINAVSAIVDPDRTLRETPEAQRRGRMASYRVQHAWWRYQAECAEHHGMAEELSKARAELDKLAADCMAEFGVAPE